MDKSGRDYKQTTRKDVRLALDTENFLPADVYVEFYSSKTSCNLLPQSILLLWYNILNKLYKLHAA